MKQLLIKKCNDSQKWYAKMIGWTVPYLGDTGTEYKSRDCDGYTNFVNHNDAEIIEVMRNDK